MSMEEMLDNVVCQYGHESEFAIAFCTAMANGASKRRLRRLYKAIMEFSFEEEKEG